MSIDLVLVSDELGRQMRRHTGFADTLVTAWCTESADNELVAACTSQLHWNGLDGEGAASMISLRSLK